jgi:hypothetical protein
MGIEGHLPFLPPGAPFPGIGPRREGPVRREVGGGKKGGREGGREVPAAHVRGVMRRGGGGHSGAGMGEGGKVGRVRGLVGVGWVGWLVISGGKGFEGRVRVGGEVEGVGTASPPPLPVWRVGGRRVRRSWTSAARAATPASLERGTIPGGVDSPPALAVLQVPATGQVREGGRGGAATEGHVRRLRGGPGRFVRFPMVPRSAPALPPALSPAFLPALLGREEGRGKERPAG